MPTDTSTSAANGHIYQRSIDEGTLDSLAMIAKLVEPGQVLLDLGMGTGALGQFLSQHFTLVADGVTLNPQEAEIARRWYRQTYVADLDHTRLTDLLGTQTYDCIVCADVLEHLKAPQALLEQCRLLLKPDGRLITSIPNTGYCGLVAELMQGDFRYRPEGLLDQTHLRFFTRQSMHRFFEMNGWHPQAVQPITRELIDSEFLTAFDALPPAVSRYLLALPDALTYQFVVVWRPLQIGTDAASVCLEQNSAICEQRKSVALFSAQLHLGTDGLYDDRRKCVALGEIGAARQQIRFEIPKSDVNYTGLRLDPADRPGFFRLRSIRLCLPNAATLWQWSALDNSVFVLATREHHEIFFQQFVESEESALLLLYGDDPWLELPLGDEALGQISRCGAQLEICADWPMSADFLQASAAIRVQNAWHAKEIERLNAQHQEATQSLERIDGMKRQIDQLLQRLLNSHNTNRVLARSLQSAQIETATKSRQFDELLHHLQTIEKSTLFRVTRPVVHLKMKMDTLLKPPQDKITVFQANMTEAAHAKPIDVIVPVYKGLEDTQRCIESVLNSFNKLTWRLVILNDQSPEPALSAWLRQVASTDSRILLLENEVNLGFVGTVNRGMAQSQQHDVLLLNSDTVVANDWLDRLQRAAYSQSRVATVTPFSNNATIFSYPKFCAANEMPAMWNTSRLDKLFSKHLFGKTVSVPTGVGFCMFIRRACLDEIGFFDEVNFGKGYGEENDFCVRAKQAGWTHLHALDTFVQHSGGVSFGESKSERELAAMRTLNMLHPTYEPEVHAFVGQDPARPARMIIDVARMTEAGKPVILNVTHNREGGTLRHIHELAHALTDKAVFLRLSPAPKGVVLKLEGVDEAFELNFEFPHCENELLILLRGLQVSHIHFHHLLGHTQFIAQLPTLLGVPHDFTLHDYYSFCPQISLTDHTDRYCGEQGLAQCRQCLERHPAPGGVSIGVWRAQHQEVLTTARYVITPSEDAAQRTRRYVPSANIQCIPHAKLYGAMTSNPSPDPRPYSEKRPLKIVVLGALSRIKGADVLEDVAVLAAKTGAPIEFHLIGYAYRSLRTQPKAHLTVHGHYADEDLPKILDWLEPDLAWFPAVWPETYSYTLSACLDCKLPVVAPNLGAFIERLQGRSWSWLCDWQQSDAQWLAFFQNIRESNFLTGNPPPLPDTCAQSLENVSTELDYGDRFTAAMPIPMHLSHQQLEEIKTIILRLQTSSNHPALPIKLSALRALMRLRATAALSPMAKLVPMHMQRRIKSWLRR